MFHWLVCLPIIKILNIKPKNFVRTSYLNSPIHYEMDKEPLEAL